MLKVFTQDTSTQESLPPGVGRVLVQDRRVDFERPHFRNRHYFLVHFLLSDDGAAGLATHRFVDGEGAPENERSPGDQVDPLVPPDLSEQTQFQVHQ